MVSLSSLPALQADLVGRKTDAENHSRTLALDEYLAQMVQFLHPTGVALVEGLS
jgi:hypothetical protein